MTRARSIMATAVLVLALVAAANRPWLEGAVNDAVLGQARVGADGGQAAPGVVALALAVLAAAVAAAVTARRLRTSLVIIGLAAALGSAALASRAVFRSADVLGPIAAASVGRTGSLEVEGFVGTWAWVGWTVCLALVALQVWTLSSSRSWPAPGDKYEREPAAREVTGSRGERVDTEWDALSRGHDPTDVPGPGQT